MLKGVNWIAVVIAVVLFEGLGMLWYGPLFGKAWLEAMGRTPDMSNQNLLMAIGAVNTLVCVVGLAWLIDRLGAASLGAALTTALAAWFFFSLTTQSLEYLYMGLSLRLLEINASYLLVSYLVSGAVIHFVKFGAARRTAAA
jgi:hypothetical protein